MSDDELMLYSSAINGKQSAIEYGVGGSTIHLANAGIGRIVSVDSDPDWVQRMSEHGLLRPYVASGALSIYHVDIGPTALWGYPRDRSRIADWPNYWWEPWRRVESETVDLVCIDGRFRVACALISILQGNQNMTIVIHDFWNRSGYHPLLKYLNFACRVETLGVFFVRGGIDFREVSIDLLRHAFVPE